MTDRLNADVFGIRKHMREAEAVADEMLVACAKLKQAMILARRNPEIRIGAGHNAVLRLQKAESAIASAYGDLLRVHDELSDIARITAGVDDGAPTEPTGISAEPITATPAPAERLAA